MTINALLLFLVVKSINKGGGSKVPLRPPLFTAVSNMVGELHAEYMIKHSHKYLVLEGDAKKYNIIQAIKHENGEDLSWLIAYPCEGFS